MKNKANILLIVMFLCGAMIFLLPILNQIQEVEQDDHEYAVMLEQYKPADSSPAPDAEELAPAVVEAEETAAGDPVPTVLPILVEVPRPTDPVSVVSSPEPSAAPDSTRNPDSTASALPVVTAAPTTAKPSATATPATSGFDALVEQNRDFVAWITIAGTPVDYPVVSSNNTEYYLHHLFNGKESKLGCLFSLKSSDYETPSRNIAIYGHHLSNSSAMFSTLIKYKDYGYYAAHPRIQLNTLYGVRTYRIFAVLNIAVSDWDPSTATFSSNQAFLRFVERAKRNALYDTGVTVNADDSILTLITCDRSYGGASGRLLVMAVME